MNGKTFGNMTIAAAGIGILILARLLINTIGLDWEWRLYPILFVLMIAGYLGIREQRLKANEELTYIMEWKAALRPPAVIAVVYSLFTFVFYSFIDPAFFKEKIAERRADFKATIDQGGTAAEDAQVILERFDEMSQLIFSPLNWSTFTLMVTVMFSLIFCALLVLLARQAPGIIAK